MYGTGQANLPHYPLQQPVYQAYQQQAAYPPVYPQHWQQPAYQGYPQQWQQPPLEPPHVYYQPPQRPQQQRASHLKYDYGYEPTMEELHWASLGIYDAPLARDNYYNQPLPQSSSYLQLTREQAAEEAKYYEERERVSQQTDKRIAYLQREIEQLQQEINQSKLEEEEELERSMQKELDVEKEKLSAQNVPSMDDEVIAATQEAENEENLNLTSENYVDFHADLEELNEKSIESACEKQEDSAYLTIPEPQSSIFNTLLSFPLQVIDTKEHIATETNLSDAVANGKYEEENMISPLCFEQSMIIIYRPTFKSMTYTIVSSPVQNFLIKHAVDNTKLLCINWKTRKKQKCMNLSEGGNLIIVLEQRSHFVFGWKPGWDPQINAACENKIKKVRRRVRKFDGTHPWDPNL